MGYFDLPRGEFELLMKKKGRGRFKEEWKSVMFTDRLDRESIAECVERWSKNYKVLGARYNGNIVQIPKGYHWEHRTKSELLGSYEAREDAQSAWQERRRYNRKNKDSKIPVGSIYFVED